MISNPVTVDEAVGKGRKMLLLPRILLVFGMFLFGFMITLLCLMIPNIDRESSSFVITYAGIIVVSFFPLVYLPYLFWSKRTTKWKLWAFDNVDRVHDLVEAASYAALFAKYGTFIDKMQIQSAAEREQWAALQSRFDNQYKYIDDTTVPGHMIIYLSTTHFIFRLIFCVFGILLGVATLYFAFKPHGPKPLAWFGGIILIAFLVLVFVFIRNFIQHKPQLTLNGKGIEILSLGFHNWAEITDEELIQKYMSKSGKRWFLRFYDRSELVEVDITALDINWVQLKKLLRVYRGRSGNVRSV